MVGTELGTSLGMSEGMSDGMSEGISDGMSLGTSLGASLISWSERASATDAHSRGNKRKEEKRVTRRIILLVGTSQEWQGCVKMLKRKK